MQSTFFEAYFAGSTAIMRTYSPVITVKTNFLRSNMRKLSCSLFIVAFCAIASVVPEAARAAVWVGGTSGLWSDNPIINPNWTSSTPPGAGAVVTFNASTTGPAANMIMNNDIITSIGVITVGTVPGGANAKPITIGGNSLTLATSGNNIVLQASSTDDLTFDLTPGNTITVATPNNNWIVNQPRTLTIKSPIVGTAASTIALSAPGSLAGGVHGTVQLLAASPNLASNITIGGPNMFVVIGDNQSFGTGNVFVNSLNSAPQLVTTGNRTLGNTMSWGSGFGLDPTSTGDLTLNGAIALTGPVGAGTNRTVNNLTATKTIFVNGDVVTSLPGDTGIRTLTLQPNPGNIVVNGKISDANSLVGALLKTQGGTATINSTNSTFAGQVQVQNGVLEVASLANQGSPSSIGSGSTTPSIQLGAATNTGTLRHIGNANSTTNRAIHLSGSTGGATLDSSGNGTMSFTSATMVTPNAQPKTLTFTGSNTGDNSFASNIINGPNATSVSKTGDGKWILTGGSNYSGGTTVTAGLLAVNNTAGSATGTGSVTVSGTGTLGGKGAVSGTVIVNAGGTLSPGESVESLGTGSLEFNATASAGSTLKFEIGPSGTADLVNAALGTLTIADPATTFGATLALSGPLVPIGSKYTVIAYNGNWVGGFSFKNAPNNTLVSVGTRDFLINYQDTTPGGNSLDETQTGAPNITSSTRFVTLVAVPELGSFLTMGLVGCCALGAVRFGKRYGFKALSL